MYDFHQAPSGVKCPPMTLRQALYNHLVLPPNLPQKQDPNIAEIEDELLERLIASARCLSDASDGTFGHCLEVVRRSLRASKNIKAGERVDRNLLIKELNTLEDGYFLVVYISCQNSALLIKRHNDAVLGPSVIFESFEAAARNQDIIAADNALSWEFPGNSVAVPLSKFYEQGFISNLATFLEHASREIPASDFTAQAFKAGTTLFEYRDTPEPVLVTSLLLAILEGNGRRTNPPLLQKRVRDDVCWNKADKPWRRLPFWLVLRVSVARYLAHRLGGAAGRVEYKTLVANLLAKFLDDIQGTEISLEQLHFLRAKLCRRLVKLEAEKYDSPLMAHRIDQLFAYLDTTAKKAIKRATDFIESSWRQQKVSMCKPIQRLPCVASDEDLVIELRQEQQLHNILNGFSRPRRNCFDDFDRITAAEAAKRHKNDFSRSYFSLADLERYCERYCEKTYSSPAETCDTVSELLSRYLKRVGHLYDGNSERQSYMILTIMELWMTMDEAVSTAYPLLRNYHPRFHPEMLDSLLVPYLKDMKRVQRIQRYLRGRLASCDHANSIFDDPSKDCFAYRSYGESADSSALVELHSFIEAQARERRLSKEQEWREKSREYNELSKLIDKASCVYHVDPNAPLGRGFHDPQCHRCRMIKHQSSIRITAYEHPLPSDPVEAKVVVFELMCPSIIAKYRDTTWFVLSQLALPAIERSAGPRCFVTEYQQLEGHSRRNYSSFRLASTTKSFLNTHYSRMQFPVEWDHVCRPNGLRIGYFDVSSSSWPGRLRCRPSYLHRVTLHIPQASPFHGLLQNKAFAEFTHGPSSYDVMSTTTRCPPGVGVQEYLSFQTLASGTARRWLAILTELGSSNLNFSNEATALLLHHLAMQCGPLGDDDDPLRVSHSIFREETFCEKLIEQLQSRLLSLFANWRETQLMQTIIDFASRLAELAPVTGLPHVGQQAREILTRARSVCLDWFKLLRAEIYTARDPETSKNFQQYALWAAVLCRRTFTLYVSQPAVLDLASLEAWIFSSITIHDNYLVKGIPTILYWALIRDLQLSHHLRDIVLRSISRHPEAFSSSLKEVWPVGEGHLRTFSAVKTEEHGWISCVAQTEGSDPQAVLYNVADGILLVDGRSIGKLPEDPKNSVWISELFEGQSLMTFPSGRNGMQYQLCVRPYGFEVHIGQDEHRSPIVRAFRHRYTLQLISRDCFMSAEPWDLPGPLVDGCFHWLNLNTGDVYITRATGPWPQDPHKGYTLNFQHRHCTRLKFINNREALDAVVSPNSRLFSSATRILKTIEHQRHVLITQPIGRHVQMELPRLQIRFYVNRDNLLQSPQLRCEIDPDQDAGTWYGLENKLVVRSTSNPLQRSVLVPFGPINVQRHGCHISLTIEPVGQYAKFQLNNTLGQVDCAPEPALVYRKGLLHAYTSFVVPDPLTGCTGFESALLWLQSGISQPFSPIGRGAMESLEKIAAMTPRREYYPQGIKVMHTDHWDVRLPWSIQDPSSRLYRLVAQIVRTSAELSMFTPNSPPIPQLKPIGPRHLHTRAMFRQQPFERILGDMVDLEAPTLKPYISRDCTSATNIRHRNVLELTSLLRTSPQKMSTTKNLAKLLAMGASVGNFSRAFDEVSVHDRLRVDMLQSWGSLVRFAREQRDPYSLMFLFGPISFSLSVDMPLVRTLVAFSLFEDLRNIDLPPWDEFAHFQPDQLPQVDYFRQLLKPFQAEPPEDTADILGGLCSAKQRKKLLVERSKFNAKVADDTEYFADFLLKQWPCLEPSIAGLNRAILLDAEAALEAIRPEWRRLYQNIELTKHLRSVQAILDQRTCHDTYEPPHHVRTEEEYPPRNRGSDGVHLKQLLLNEMREAHSSQEIAICTSSSPAPSTLSGNVWKASAAHRHLITNGTQPAHAKAISNPLQISTPVADLSTIVERLSDSRSSVRKLYAEYLRQSLQSFRDLKPKMQTKYQVMVPRDKMIAQKRQKVDGIFQILQQAIEQPTLGFSARRIELLKAGKLWPIVTKWTVLRQLGSTSCQSGFGSGMRQHIIDLGVSITQLQKEIRLHGYAMNNEAGRYFEELSNDGHTNWSPNEHPDWLLLEVDSNMIIRPVQVDVALATIAPASEANSVLQMNMGQGKTSIIIPMATAALANRKQLARVIVPKALLQQTGQLLQARLGGLLNRQLRHVPFARRTPATEDVIRAYHGIHRYMLKSAGIMLCQPEHNLSFMLSSQQRLLDNQLAQAGPMMNIQSWLVKYSRDILDESDYTLAVKTQLIYPSGTQTAVDGHPHRWHIAQALLRLVDMHTYELSSLFPHSIEVVRRPGGGFPFLHFLRTDVEEALLYRLIKDVCQLGDVLPVGSMSAEDLFAVKDFISATKPRVESTEAVRHLCPDRPHIRQAAYLLRGLLVNRILMMTLKKRWNVQYGLHPLRDPIAVPFHAKGVPSDQSEWGHPDVAILFTCLAFYYQGLGKAQLRQCVDHMLKLDDPSTEYDKWTQSTENFPSSLKAWNSINVHDEMQLAEIWKAVQYNVVVIDYFLNTLVFPKNIKQFKVKLNASGWDIPLSPLTEMAENEARKPLTTGFSGTNDNRTMLPLNIKQQDLPSLSHTSAEVLTYLLQERNRYCALPHDIAGRSNGRANEKDLLYALRNFRIRVFIDAGACILSMTNEQVAQQWLQIDGSALAALYFDEANKPWILAKSTLKKTPLLASPFADDLSQCLVYLDEAHTRGTDLKLPVEARGALTLGLGQTKDHTVQAAMRLRQLGTTQSITFFVPPEVHQSVADLRGKTMSDRIDSADVIAWLLDNTCDSIESLGPLYYSQGLDWCRRMQAALDYPNLLKDKRQREAYVAEVKQDEQQTLQQLYKPKTKTRSITATTFTNAKLRGYMQELNSLKKSFQDTGKAVHGSALQEVEQEREVAFEVESVKQVKKLVHHQAYTFPGLHPQLESFVRTGRLPADTTCFTHLFRSLAKTAIGRKFRVFPQVTDSKIFVSTEFDRTVKLNTNLTIDNFIRPVNWILWSNLTEAAVVIIPEEAEALLPMMRDRTLERNAYLLTYAAPTTRRMREFNDLTYFSVPPLPSDWRAPDWLRLQLGIYAGRLWFDWDEYKPLCKLMGIEDGCDEKSDQELDQVDAATADEAISLDVSTSALATNCQAPVTTKRTAQVQLVSRPLTFLQEWLAVRRHGQDSAHSPLGFLAQGKTLQENHPFFQKTEMEGKGPGKEVETKPVPATYKTHPKATETNDYHEVDDTSAIGVSDMNAAKDEAKYNGLYLGNEEEYNE